MSYPTQETAPEQRDESMTLEEFAALYAPPTITGYLIDVEREIAEVRTIEKSLRSYYELLNCSIIDITSRRIGHYARRRYDIVCDDEALLKEPQRISAIDNLGTPMLCGNLFIVKFDGVEDNVSLDADDVKFLKRFILPQGTRNHPKPYPMLHQCEYDA